MVLRLSSLVAALVLSTAPLIAADADLILHSGKVVTVDSTFSIADAVAVKDGRIVAVGRTTDILARERGSKTAALSELTTPFAVARSYTDIQGYIRERASTTPKGEWIQVPKTCPGRLAEMRMPDPHVLDAATEHPVFYDASCTASVADLVVIDRDYLTCVEDDIRRIEPVTTIVEGRVVYSR